MWILSDIMTLEDDRLLIAFKVVCVGRCESIYTIEGIHTFRIYLFISAFKLKRNNPLNK